MGYSSHIRKNETTKELEMTAQLILIKKNGKTVTKTFKNYEQGFRKNINVNMKKYAVAELWNDGIRVLRVEAAK